MWIIVFTPKQILVCNILYHSCILFRKIKNAYEGFEKNDTLRTADLRSFTKVITSVSDLYNLK